MQPPSKSDQEIAYIFTLLRYRFNNLYSDIPEKDSTGNKTQIDTPLNPMYMDVYTDPTTSNDILVRVMFGKKESDVIPIIIGGNPDLQIRYFVSDYRTPLEIDAEIKKIKSDGNELEGGEEDDNIIALVMNQVTGDNKQKLQLFHEDNPPYVKNRELRILNIQKNKAEENLGRINPQNRPDVQSDFIMLNASKIPDNPTVRLMFIQYFCMKMLMLHTAANLTREMLHQVQKDINRKIDMFESTLNNLKTLNLQQDDKELKFIYDDIDRLVSTHADPEVPHMLQQDQSLTTTGHSLSNNRIAHPDKENTGKRNAQGASAS